MFSKPENGLVDFFGELIPCDSPILIAEALYDSLENGYAMNAFFYTESGYVMGIVELGPYEFHLYKINDAIEFMPLGSGKEYGETLLRKIVQRIFKYKDAYEEYIEGLDDFFQDMDAYFVRTLAS